MTFRSIVGRPALWAWIGSHEDSTGTQPVGVHFNDRTSVGLRDGELHIENEGIKGQFTMYCLRPADSRNSTIDLEFEVKVLRNDGKAASVSIPFGGVLRIFPDKIMMKHDPALKASISSGQFHKYRVECGMNRLRIHVDGKPAIDTDKGDSRCFEKSYYSRYGLAFGNEENGAPGKDGEETPHTMWPMHHPDDITPEVTGYGIWREFKAKTSDPDAGTRQVDWRAGEGRFPDQYQQDHIIEVDASITGGELGYSDWVQMEDGSVFLVSYSDDTSHACVKGNSWRQQVPWIRGTFIKPEDMGV